MVRRKPQDRARRWKAASGASAAEDPVAILYRSGDGMAVGQLESPPRKSAGEARRAAHEAEARSTHIAYMLAAAGHDLRQPLQVVAMALDRLAPALIDPRQREWLQIARGEISSLNASLVELAIAARIGEPEFQSVDLADLVHTAVDGWRHHAAARGLALRLREQSCTVHSDPRLLLTLLRNLVGNAVRHTCSGGVLVACRRRNGGVRIDVVDTGPGLPAGDIDRLFQPYRRGHPDGEGLGLGLALVRDAAERLGCAVSVRSTTGRGACFSLQIPDVSSAPHD